MGRSEASEPRSAPTVGQVVLGRRLQDLRERAGLKREEAAKVLRVAPATIRRMETAEVALKIPTCSCVLQAYGVEPEEADGFVRLAEEANKPGWWQRFHDVLPGWFSMYVSLEGAASLIRAYEPHFVPGLLQTEDYARAVLRAGAVGPVKHDDIERHVALRMERQALLTRPEPPRFWVVMDETVLRRRGHRPRRHAGPGGPAPRSRRAAPRHPAGRGVRDGPPPRHVRPLRALPVRHAGAPGHGLQRVPDRRRLSDARPEVASHLEVMDRMAAQAATAQRTKEILRGFRKEL